MAATELLHRVRAAWQRVPLHWDRDEILAVQVQLLRRSFPMTLAASVLTSLGSAWLLSLVVPLPIMLGWLGLHMLVVSAVYLGLRPLPRALQSPRLDAVRLTRCMAAMGLLWGSLGLIVWQFSTSIDGVIYCVGILSTVSSGALGLGAPMLRAYIVYLSCAVAGAVLAILHLPGPAIAPSLVLAAAYYGLTWLHARNLSKVARDSIEIQFENERLVARLRAESQRAMAAQDAAEQADRDKSRFLAAASHDLRQPLHAMGLFLESLQRSTLDAHQRTVLGHAYAASGAASEMLTTLLDYSRLEAGVVKVRPEAFAVQPLLTALEQEFGAQADSAGLVYRTRESSAAAFADRSLVGLVMHNFISNALRYTARGGVLIACRTRGKRLALEVWDTGQGIPRSQWDAVFKEFHQLGNPERDRRKGLGLGLATVRRLAREMKTSVELRSRPGRGSVFRLWLDRWQGALEDDTAPAPDARSLAGLKVLAIDDDEGVRMGMQSLLHSWGCHSITADSGAQALELLEDFVPDLIVTDFRLRHDETGKEALQALRTYLGVTVPAIILTGDTSPQRLRDAQSTGALLLHKPVSTHQLRTAMVHLITHPEATAPPHPAPLGGDPATTSAAAAP